MVQRQVRLSEESIKVILEVIIPEYHKQYPILVKHSKLTKPLTVNDGVAFLIKFWEDNW